MGNVPGSKSPSVPFSYPMNPLSGISPETADTNFGRDVATESRKMPLGWFDGEQRADEPPITGTFAPCSPDAWGYTKK